jgi:hypothetical protein
MDPSSCSVIATAGATQEPLNRGERRSRNAATPSAKSAERMPCSRAFTSSARPSWPSTEQERRSILRARRFARIESGANVAICVAVATATLWSFSGSAIRLISPSSYPRCALTVAPARHMSAAIANGSSLISRSSPPGEYTRPSRPAGAPRLAAGTAMRISHASASSRPPPNAAPFSTLQERDPLLRRSLGPADRRGSRCDQKCRTG